MFHPDQAGKAGDGGKSGLPENKMAEGPQGSWASLVQLFGEGLGMQLSAPEKGKMEQPLRVRLLHHLFLALSQQLSQEAWPFLTAFTAY